MAGHYPFEGNYSGFLEQKEARIVQEKRDDDKRNRTLKRELEWVRMAPKARQSKGKARLAAYDKLLEEAQSRRGSRMIYRSSSPPTSDWAMW
jgi:sulfate-transporting ATPase